MITTILQFFLALANPIYAATSAVLEPRAPAPFTNFVNNYFFYPAADSVLWQTLYARTLQLPGSESLIITWENYPAEPPLVTAPIWKSDDGGASWYNYSQVVDTQNGWGLRFQPFLFTLPRKIGNFHTGTILLATVSAPESLEGGVYIDLYASTDLALTWSFVSHIVHADGPEIASGGNYALWEPFILLYGKSIVVYYSDQSDPAHSQKLSYKTTSDLLNWSSSQDAVAYDRYNDRPGMATVAHIESTDKWILTYEYCGSGECSVYYRLATSPYDFQSATGIRLQAQDGTTVVSSPYVIWYPNPARSDGSGVIVVNGLSDARLFYSDDNATAGNWALLDVGQDQSYSRSLRVITVDGEDRILIGNGGRFRTSGNAVGVGVVDLVSF
jgi:hypothetical protein